MTAGYGQLVALAEREWSIVAAEAWEQLPALVAERAALLATLPAVPPPAAAAPLGRLLELQTLTSAALAAALTDATPALARLSSGRDAVHGYAAAAAMPRTSG